MCYLYTVVRQFLVQASNIIHTRNEADIIILYVFLIKIHAPRLVHAWCVCVCCMLYWIDNILVLIFANARAREYVLGTMSETRHMRVWCGHFSFDHSTIAENSLHYLLRNEFHIRHHTRGCGAQTTHKNSIIEWAPELLPYLYPKHSVLMHSCTHKYPTLYHTHTAHSTHVFHCIYEF